MNTAQQRHAAQQAARQLQRNRRIFNRTCRIETCVHIFPSRCSHTACTQSHSETQHAFSHAICAPASELASPYHFSNMCSGTPGGAGCSVTVVDPAASHKQARFAAGLLPQRHKAITSTGISPLTPLKWTGHPTSKLWCTVATRQNAREHTQPKDAMGTWPKTGGCTAALHLLQGCAAVNVFAVVAVQFLDGQGFQSGAVARDGAADSAATLLARALPVVQLQPP